MWLTHYKTFVVDRFFSSMHFGNNFISSSSLNGPYITHDTIFWWNWTFTLNWNYLALCGIFQILDFEHFLRGLAGRTIYIWTNLVSHFQFRKKFLLWILLLSNYFHLFSWFYCLIRSVRILNKYHIAISYFSMCKCPNDTTIGFQISVPICQLSSFAKDN